MTEISSKYGTVNDSLQKSSTTDENSWVYRDSSAAALTGIITGTATNPIWIVKTRLQLVQGDKKVLGGS